MSWEKLTMKKEFGGMGFWHLHTFNHVMLGSKIGNWYPIKILLFTRSTKLNISHQRRSWKLNLGIILVPFSVPSIHGSLVVLRQDLIWRIGNGSSINVWSQAWLNTNLNLIPSFDNDNASLVVGELIKHQSGQ